MYNASFASDNYAPAHPRFMEAITRANLLYERAYGDDSYTQAAQNKFKELFSCDLEVFFVFNGTAANVVSLQACTQSFSSILCSEWAHIQNDECGAPEKFTQCKIQCAKSMDGKISPTDLGIFLARQGDQHAVQPSVISISQTTELGTVYTPEEVAELGAFAKKSELYLHMDGARLSNAAAALGVPPKKFTVDSGVDILSFGGTKIGMLFGEAIIVFNPKLAASMKFYRKQSMQLSSKMRFISAQFLELLKEDLYLDLGRHANAMARLLESMLRALPGVIITQKVEANAVFVRLPDHDYSGLQKKFPFYIWQPDVREARLMCSWDTEAAQIEDFVAALSQIIA